MCTSFRRKTSVLLISFLLGLQSCNQITPADSARNGPLSLPGRTTFGNTKSAHLLSLAFLQLLINRLSSQ